MIFLLVLLRYFIYFSISNVIGTLVLTSHVLEWQNKVKIVLAFHWQHPKLKLPVSFRLLLERFLQEHNFVCYCVVRSSAQFWGKIILAVIWTQIPINIVFLKKIVSGGKETPLSLKLIFIIFCTVQLCIFTLMFAPLSWCQKVYHSSKKLLPRMMIMTTGSGPWWWTLRFKYNDLYGRLMGGPKFAMSVGPLHAITYLSSIEFLSTYIAYILMTFSQKSIIR